MVLLHTASVLHLLAIQIETNPHTRISIAIYIIEQVVCALICWGKKQWQQHFIIIVCHWHKLSAVCSLFDPNKNISDLCILVKLKSITLSHIHALPQSNVAS